MVALLWFYIAIGITAVLSILGALAITSAQYELYSGKRAISIAGEVDCLPHQKGLFRGPETGECRIGFLGKNGNYYGLRFQEDDKYSPLLLSSAEGSGQSFIITGTMTIPPPMSPFEDFDRYDIVAVVNVFNVSTETQ